MGELQAASAPQAAITCCNNHRGPRLPETRSSDSRHGGDILATASCTESCEHKSSSLGFSPAFPFSASQHLQLASWHPSRIRCRLLPVTPPRPIKRRQQASPCELGGVPRGHQTPWRRSCHPGRLSHRSFSFPPLPEKSTSKVGVRRTEEWGALLGW